MNFSESSFVSFLFRKIRLATCAINLYEILRICGSAVEFRGMLHIHLSFLGMVYITLNAHNRLHAIRSCFTRVFRFQFIHFEWKYLYPLMLRSETFSFSMNEAIIDFSKFIVRRFLCQEYVNLDRM